MDERERKQKGLEGFLQPITVDGCTVIINFSPACIDMNCGTHPLDAIREILLESYHTE